MLEGDSNAVFKQWFERLTGGHYSAFLRLFFRSFNKKKLHKIGQRARILFNGGF